MSEIYRSSQISPQSSDSGNRVESCFLLCESSFSTQNTKGNANVLFKNADSREKRAFSQITSLKFPFNLWPNKWGTCDSQWLISTFAGSGGGAQGAQQFTDLPITICKTDVRIFSLSASGQRVLSGLVSIRLDLESSRIQGL